MILPFENTLFTETKRTLTIIMTSTMTITMTMNTIPIQYKELTPNLTRRAQCANWLVFYREELFGYTVEELKERRQRKKEAAEEARKRAGKDEEWSPPVREVY